MAVTISNEELDIFNKNGFTDDDVQSTVNRYRSEGLDDNAIRVKVQERLNGWGYSQPTSEATTPKPTNPVAPKAPEPTTNINNPTQQPTKTLTGGVSVNVTNPNKSQSTWRNAGRQFARGTARALAPEKLENWAVGSKNDEALLNQYIQSGVPTYEQIDKDYRAGKIDKAQLKVLVNKRKNFDDLMADAEYRNVRNKNIGKGTLEVGTAAIGGGAGTAAAKVGMQAIKQGSKQLAKQALKEVGKTSAIGAGYGASEGVIDENINPATNALKQGAIWGATHAATLGAGKGIQAAANTKAGKAVGKAVSDAKAKIDDKVFDAITSTEAGTKALQAVENAKNAIGKELTKERTFKQAKQAKANATQQASNPSMLEEAGSPVESQTGINTQETNLPHVNEAPTSSNTSGVMAERGTISKLRELGVDTSDLPDDVRLYEKKTYQDTKRQLDALTPEERARLVNEGNTSSDVSNLAMIEEMKNSLDNGVVPYDLLSRYTKAGTEQARTLQSRSYLTNTPEGSLAALHKAMQDVAPGVKKLQEQSKELTEAFLKGDKRAINNIINKAGLRFNKNKTDFIDDLNYLKENNLLNENEVAKLVDDKFGIGKVTKEDYDNFVDMYNKLYQLPNDSREYEVQKALIGKYIADKLPVSWGQKVKTLRNMGWLLNFKTTERNIFGNTFFNAVEKGIVDPLAAGIDKGVSLFTGERTRVLPQYKELAKGFWDGIRYGIDDVNRGINTKGGVNLSGRYDLHPNTFRWHSWKDIKNVWKESKNINDAIAQEASMVVDNALHPFEKLLGYELQATDRAFYQSTYNESIKNQLLAKGLKEPTDEIRKIANEEALESVFQNNSLLHEGLAKFKSGANKMAHIGDVGLGDLTIPYVQTPANIGQQAINYSPLGLLKAFYKGIKTGNQRNFSKDLSRAIVGTTGAYGAKKAIDKAGYEIIGKPENYDKEYKNNITMGKQYEAIKAPDGTYYSYTNLDPASSVIRNAINLNEAVELAKNEKGVNKAKAVLPLLRGAIQPTADMLGDTTDLLKALQDAGQKGKVGKLIDYTGSKIVDSASSGFAKNIANAVDPYQRETKAKTLTETSINKLISGTPLRTKLPVKVDSAGRPVKTKGFVQEVFNPIKITKASKDKVFNAIDTLGKTNSAFYLPQVTNKVTFKQGNEEVTKELSPKQLTDYQRRLGQMALTYRYRLLNGKDPSKMSDNQKEDIARQIQNFDSAAKQVIASDMFEANAPNALRKGKTRVSINKQKLGNIGIAENLYNQVKQQEEKQTAKEKRIRLEKRARGK